MTCEGSPERYRCPLCGWSGGPWQIAWKGRWASEHEGELICPACGHSGMEQVA